jgi:hypothetical protein
MCREDIRIARQKYSAVTIVAIPNGSNVKLVGASRNRTHITISGNNGAFVVGPKGQFSGAGSFIFLPTVGIPLEFDIEKEGMVVTNDWEATGNGVAATAIVIETFFDDGVYP